MEKKWYVIHTLSGQETRVRETLLSKIKTDEMGEYISQILIPTENVMEVKSGKKTIIARKFYPGYVLLEMTLTDEVWYFVRNTPGVIGFVGTGQPAPIADNEVEEILSQIDEKKEKVKPKVLFEKGESVKVTEGPFVNFSGLIDEINPDKGKLKVMVSIFGRATPVELEYWQVERQ